MNSNRSVHVEAPFRANRMSGIGRELGIHGMELDTELTNIKADLG